MMADGSARTSESCTTFECPAHADCRSISDSTAAIFDSPTARRPILLAANWTMMDTPSISSRPSRVTAGSLSLGG